MNHSYKGVEVVELLKVLGVRDVVDELKYCFTCENGLKREAYFADSTEVNFNSNDVVWIKLSNGVRHAVNFSHLTQLSVEFNKVTAKHVESLIVAENYHQFISTTVTICCLELKNGFNSIGQSAMFNAEQGKKLAREDAVSNIWQLEGYLLAERLAADK